MSTGRFLLLYRFPGEPVQSHGVWPTRESAELAARHLARDMVRYSAPNERLVGTCVFEVYEGDRQATDKLVATIPATGLGAPV